MDDVVPRITAVALRAVCRQGAAAARHTVTVVKLEPTAAKRAAYLQEQRAVRVVPAMSDSFAVVVTIKGVHREGRNAVGAGDTAVMEIDALSTKVGWPAVLLVSVDRVMEVTSFRAQGGRP